MRRTDREVRDINGVFDIVDRCSVVHLGMVDNGKPYVVALNFGYDREGDTLIMYLHCAMVGKKIKGENMRNHWRNKIYYISIV